jgi:hypothetical protein
MRDFVLTCDLILTRTLLLIALILGLTRFLGTTVLSVLPVLLRTVERVGLVVGVRFLGGVIEESHRSVLMVVVIG